MKCENSILGTRCSLEKDHAGRCMFLDDAQGSSPRRCRKIHSIHQCGREEGHPGHCYFQDSNTYQKATPDFDVKKINECNALKGEILELKARVRNTIGSAMDCIRCPESSMKALMDLYESCK